MPSRKTLQEILRQRQQEEFVGREDQLTDYARNLTLPVERRRFIFNVYGQGGVGKTSLLRRFRQVLEPGQSFTTWADESDRDIPTVMGRMVEQLEKQGADVKTFKDRYAVYRQRRQELETDPDAPKGLPNFLGRTLARTGIHFARRAPAVGVAFEFVDEEAFAAQAGEWLGYIAKKISNKDEVQLLQEPVEVLTPLLLEVLQKISETRTIGLFFDTYERTSEYLDSWLRKLLNDRYGSVPANIVISIAGQVELDKNNWAPFEGIVARLPLELFTVEEVKEYLLRKGIRNEQVVEVITNLSGQLPLLVATLASESPHDLQGLGDPSGTAVERFLKWVEDPRKRQVALDAALPRQINEDILSVLIGSDESGDLFAWLSKMPFVRDGGLRYHPVVRSQILRHKRRNSPHGWSTLHGKLADFHQTLRDDLAVTSVKKYLNPDWQKHSLETAYHQLCQSPHGRLGNALNQFLAFFDVSRRFAREWAEVLQQAGDDCDNMDLKSWGIRLIDGVKAFEEERYSEASAMFTALLEDTRIDEVSRSLSLDHRGSIFSQLRLYNQALEDLNRAIELQPDNPNYWVDSAEVHRQMKQQETAIAKYTRAVELRPKSARALTGRAHSYFDMGDFSKALCDFSKALEIRPNYAWALIGRGRLFVELQRFEEARNDFERAAQINAEYEHVSQKEIGKSLVAEGQFSDAANAFVKALKITARCLECWTSWAKCLNKLCSPNQTLALMSEALPIDGSQDLLSCRAEALRTIGLTEFAFRDFDEALRINTEEVSALKGRAKTFLQIKRPEKALEDLNAVLNLKPNEAHALALRGDALLQINKLEAALKDFERAIDLDSSFFHTGQRKIGMVLMKLKRYEDAKVAFIAALKAEPACRPCWLDLGRAYARLGMRDNVPQFLNESGVPDTEKPLVTACRGEALITLGFYKEALAALENAILSNGTLSRRFGNSYGLMLACDGRYTEAIQVYESLLEGRQSTDVLYNRAVATVRGKGVHNAKQQIEAVEVALNEAVKTQSTAGQALYGFAGLSAVVGDRSKALSLLERAIALEPAAYSWVKQDTAWDEMRDEPSLQHLVQTSESEELGSRKT